MFNIPEKPFLICKTLKDAGFEAYLVGGAIRDLIMGREPNDWDVATNARPRSVIKLFDRVFKTGIKHGTVTVVLDDERFEVTSYRTHGVYSDGRHPDKVKFVKSIDVDLSRRDFTMNAIAYDPITHELRDPFDGKNDINAYFIRAVGSAEKRFREDGLRMLRAARFTSTLGFFLTRNITDAINDNIPLNIAQERIHDEFCKALVSKFPANFFWTLAYTGLLHRIVPELEQMIGCEQNKYHEFDVWEHTMHVLNACQPNLHLRLAALFHDIAKPQVKGVHPTTGEATFYDHENASAELADKIMERLRFSNDDRKRVTHLIRHHLIQYTPDWSSASIRRWIRKVGAENVSDLLALARADIVGKGKAKCVVDFLYDLEVRISTMNFVDVISNTTQLAIDGNDVMQKLGIGPGRVVGDTLKRLLDVVTEDPELNTREKLLEMIKNV